MHPKVGAGAVFSVCTATMFIYIRLRPPGIAFTYCWLFCSVLAALTESEDALALAFCLGFGLNLSWYISQLVDSMLWTNLIPYWDDYFPKWCQEGLIRVGDILLHPIPLLFLLPYSQYVSFRTWMYSFLLERWYFVLVEGQPFGTGNVTNIIYDFRPHLPRRTFLLSQYLTNLGYLLAAISRLQRFRVILQALWFLLLVIICLVHTDRFRVRKKRNGDNQKEGGIYSNPVLNKINRYICKTFDDKVKVHRLISRSWSFSFPCRVDNTEHGEEDIGDHRAYDKSKYNFERSFSLNYDKGNRSQNWIEKKWDKRICSLVYNDSQKGVEEFRPSYFTIPQHYYFFPFLWKWINRGQFLDKWFSCAENLIGSALETPFEPYTLYVNDLSSQLQKGVLDYIEQLTQKHINWRGHSDTFKPPQFDILRFWNEIKFETKIELSFEGIKIDEGRVLLVWEKFIDLCGDLAYRFSQHKRKNEDLETILQEKKSMSETEGIGEKDKLFRRSQSLNLSGTTAYIIKKRGNQTATILAPQQEEITRSKLYMKVFKTPSSRMNSETDLGFLNRVISGSESAIITSGIAGASTPMKTAGTETPSYIVQNETVNNRVPKKVKSRSADAINNSREFRHRPIFRYNISDIAPLSFGRKRLRKSSFHEQSSFDFIEEQQRPKNEITPRKASLEKTGGGRLLPSELQSPMSLNEFLASSDSNNSSYQTPQSFLQNTKFFSLDKILPSLESLEMYLPTLNLKELKIIRFLLRCILSAFHYEDPHPN